MLLAVTAGAAPVRHGCAILQGVQVPRTSPAIQMSEPPAVPPTGAGQTPLRNRRGTSWAELAGVCGAFGLIIVLFLGWCSMRRAEALALGLVVAPVVLS